MNLERRIALLKMLGEYIVSQDPQWLAVKEKAFYQNGWFIPEFVDFQLQQIAENYLDEGKLRAWVDGISEQDKPKTVGLVMAGNIPLAGFHDFLTVFVYGHRQAIKPSSKDIALIEGIIAKLTEWEPSIAGAVTFADRLNNCDAYIATGSNNSARYFEYYFSRYPHIIRRNRTSAAILTGHETRADLERLADDVYLYFGLGCRNVTKIYVPRHYDFVTLLDAFKKYNTLFDHHKYKNNYDYQLAIMIINKIFYMTNGSLLLREDQSVFSPISQLNYEFYDDAREAAKALEDNPDIQCIVGDRFLPFGQAQRPALADYADKADTLRFLAELA